MNLKLLLLSCVLFLNLIGRTFAQNDPVTKFSPVSPEAASLGKYGDVPVSLYTGIPNIQIPIYEVKVGDFSLPISLSYHAGGNRVEDIASWVGVGWNLNAGGVINRQQNGRQDERMLIGYQSQSIKDQIDDIMDSPDEDGITPLGSPWGYDTDPDYFNFNFSGNSGKFFFNPQGDYFFLPQEHKIKVKIDKYFYQAQYQRNFIARWLLTDDSGIEYVFGASRGDDQNKEYYEISHKIEDINTTPDYSRKINSWYLNEILLPNGDKIEFKYDYLSYDLRVNLPSSNFLALNPENQIDPNCTGESHSSGKFSFERVLQLKEITYPNGKLVFVPGQIRSDVPSASLDEIQVYNKNDGNFELVKSFKLSYRSYGTDLSRLLLHKLEEISGDATLKKAHDFEYNNIQLPGRLSYSQDLWGYYNGQPNPSLVPTLIFRDPPRGIGTEIQKANRAVDPDYTQAGILKKITYPTGGWTEYQYENNTFRCQTTDGLDNCYVLDNTNRYPTELRKFHLSLQNNEEGNAEAVSEIFRLEAGFVRYDGSVRPEQFNFDDICPSEDRGPGIKLYSCIHVWLEKIATDGRVEGAHQNDYLGLSEYVGEGNYRIRIKWDRKVNGKVFFDLVTTWDKKPVGIKDFERLAGGIRIKKIIDFDPYQGGRKERTFDYHYGKLDKTDNNVYLEGQSSGNLMNLPIYFYNGYHCTLANGGMICHATYLNSSPQTSLLSRDGINVGYSKVTTYHGFDGRNGKEEYYFTTSKDYPDIGIFDQAHFPFPHATSYSWRRGLLYQKKIFEHEGVELKEVLTEETVFDFNDSSEDPNDQYYEYFQTYDVPLLSTTGGTYCTELYRYRKGKIATESFYPKRTTRTEIFEGEKTLTTTYSSQQDALVLLPSEQSFVDSDGQHRKTYIRYAGSQAYQQAVHSDTFSKGIEELLAHNRLRQPIETYTTIINDLDQELVTSAQLITYYTDKPLPYQVYSLEIEKPIPLKEDDPAHGFVTSYINATGNFNFDLRYKMSFEFKEYDSKYALKHLIRRGNQNQAVIWGYNNQYPVAIAQNAEPDEVAFSSFEQSNKGNWTYTGNVVGDVSAPAGEYVYQLTSAKNIRKLSMDIGKTYKMTFWYKNGSSFSIDASNIISQRTGGTQKGWAYKEVIFNQSASVAINGTGFIDELKLCPIESQMTSYTYKPQVGMTSQSDNNGMIIRYKYDELGRLSLVYDPEWNILKTLDYHYENN